jgi:hypothetical protein
MTVTTDIVGCVRHASAPEILQRIRELYESSQIAWTRNDYLIVRSFEGEDHEFAVRNPMEVTPDSGDVFCAACLEGMLGLVTGVDTSNATYMDDDSTPDPVKEAERALCQAIIDTGFVRADGDGRGLVEAYNDDVLTGENQAIALVDAALALLSS